MAGVRFPSGKIDFSLIHVVQTVCEAHTASYTIVTGVYFPRQSGRAVKLTITSI
jgi:hypothetical protein